MNEAHLKETVGIEEHKQTTQQGPSNGSTLAKPNPAPWAALRSLRAATEIHAISRALEESGWNRKHAAKLLSISYRGLLYKIRQYNITPASGNSLSQGARPEV